MKLLLDQNLSDRIPARIADLFPGSSHVKLAGLAQVDDSLIADWAKREGFMIVSKDTDFYRRSMVFGHPPKSSGSGSAIARPALAVDLLRRNAELIRAFGVSEAKSVLILERTLGDDAAAGVATAVSDT